MISNIFNVLSLAFALLQYNVWLLDRLKPRAESAMADAENLGDCRAAGHERSA